MRQQDLGTMLVDGRSAQPGILESYLLIELVLVNGREGGSGPGTCRSGLDRRSKRAA